MTRFRSLFVAIACSISATACRPETTASSAAPVAQRAVAQPVARIPSLEPVVRVTTPPAAYNGPLPPLPQVPYLLPRSPVVVQAVFTFAARHAEVLHYVPCFCGCQRSGHKDNDDCFIKSRDAN